MERKRRELKYHTPDPRAVPPWPAREDLIPRNADSADEPDDKNGGRGQSANGEPPEAGSGA